MKNEKKIIFKRLMIFIVLSFVPFLIAVPVLNTVMGGRIFDGELSASPVTALVGLLGMMCPAVASILTRMITKEGFKNTYLRANFNGNMKYYLLAVIIPVVYSFTGAFIIRIAYGAAQNNGMSSVKATSLIVMQIGTSIIMAFYGLGEELGWRGYMMPKLEKLIGTPASVIAGGLIWGLWHAPLTCSGHNFGTDYKGFPFVGIGMMCVFCVLMNSILTFMTKRTRSVYPAAIFHTVNNNIISVMILLICTPDASIISSFCFIMIPIGIIAVITFLLMLNDNKKVCAKSGPPQSPVASAEAKSL